MYNKIMYHTEEKVMQWVHNLLILDICTVVYPALQSHFGCIARVHDRKFMVQCQLHDNCGRTDNC